MRASWISCVTVAVLSTITMNQGIAAEGDAGPVRALAQRAATLADALPELAASKEALETQQSSIVDKLSEVLALPGRGAMAAGTLETLSDGELVIEQVAYHWADDVFVSANLIRLRETSGRRPAVIISPDWMGHYTWTVYRPLVEQLAQAGVVVLFVDDPHVGRRQSTPAGLYVSSAAAGTSVMGIRVHDVLRGLDYLLTRDDVDAGKVGVAGLGQGGMTAWMAAALEPRLQFAVPVCGTVTFAGLAGQLAEVETIAADALQDASLFVPGVLKHFDMDLVAACVAPRSVLAIQSTQDGIWSAAGGAEALAAAEKAYGLVGKADSLKLVEKPIPHSMSAVAEEVVAWVGAQVDQLPSSEASPAPCAKLPEAPQFKLIAHFGNRAAAAEDKFAQAFRSKQSWQTTSAAMVDWLRGAAGIDQVKLDAGKVKNSAEKGPLVIETLQLSDGAGGAAPGVLVRPANPPQSGNPAVILSHGGLQSVNASRIVLAVRQLVAGGYCVVVPEHVSTSQASLRSVSVNRMGIVYGLGDAVGRTPLGGRILDNLAALAHLASRDDVDPQRIAIAGIGVGALDAALTAALDSRVLAVSLVDPITYHSWAADVAPEALYYLGVAPYFPGMIGNVDLGLVAVSVAPRPTVIVIDRSEGSESAYEQLAKAAGSAFELAGTRGPLQLLNVREMTKEAEQSTPEGLQRQAIAAARALVPEPPAPGMVGAINGMKSRASVDSGEGIVWLLETVDRYKQRFVDGGYELQQWSFYNDNKQANAGRLITPLIFQKTGDQYQLTGIGKTRTNDGSGLQTFDFEPTEGSARVGREYWFGWHTGDGEGKTNPGVAEFDNAPDSLATILSGPTTLKVGSRFSPRNSYPRLYSIQAVSKKPGEAEGDSQ